MNTRVHLAIHCIIGIAAIAMMGYAFYQPLATVPLNYDDNLQASDELYITQECVSLSAKGEYIESQCGNIEPVFKPHMQAIMGVVLALMVCIVLELIGFSFGGTISNFFGLLVLGLSIAVIVLVAILSNFYRGSDSNTFKLTNTSIGVLVVASLLVLCELCCNKLVHRVVLAPYRLIAGKKA